MKTADVCLQEPKLRKMGQALFIPARDYDVLTWHPLGFSQTTQPKYKNRDQHDFSPCAGATAGCLFFSYTNKSWQTSYNQALSWCTTLCPMLAAQMIKNLPAMQESQVPSLGWEDPLGKQMATHSSTSTNISESNHKIWIRLCLFSVVLGYELVFSPLGFGFNEILWGNLASVTIICLKLSDNGK